jgi:tetratricopeptide (TPR) repeat protein
MYLNQINNLKENYVNHNLDQLLKDLEIETGMEKVAAAPNVSQELADILGAKDEMSMTKKAQLEGEKLAQKLMEKFATEISNGNDLMVAEAPAATPIDPGTVAEVTQDTLQKAIDNGVQTADQADTVFDDQKDQNMNKLATEITEQNAEMMATQAVADPTPSEGQPNEVLQAIIDKTVAAGGTSNNIDADAVEKAAACSALVEAGMDFESAVDLVKQAEVAIQADDFEMQKRAALGELLEAGIDYDQAVELVKEATEGIVDKAKKYLPAAGLVAGVLAGEKLGGTLGAKLGVKALAHDADALARGKPRGLVLDEELGANLGSIAGGAAGLYAGRKLKAVDHDFEMQKRAALSELLEAGVDYDQAVELVKEAAEGIVDKAKKYLPAAGLVAGAAVGAKLGAPLGGKLAVKAFTKGVTDADALVRAKLGGLLLGPVVGANLGMIAGGTAGLYAGKKLKAVDHDFEMQKRAALSELLEAGIDYDQAVELVKEAADGIVDKAKENAIVNSAMEMTSHDKTAALGELLEAGIDYDQAVELVKEACESLEA